MRSELTFACRRGAALTAVSLFTIGTALCGLAPSMMTLIAGRLVSLFRQRQGPRGRVLTSSQIAGMGGGESMVQCARILQYRNSQTNCAGGMMAVSSIVASDLIPLKKRALFQGLGRPFYLGRVQRGTCVDYTSDVTANLWFGAGAGLGGPLGGLIAATPLGWRGAFLSKHLAQDPPPDVS